MRGAQLDADRQIRQVRIHLRHLSIKQEGGVGVEFFLELPELFLAEIPGTAFEHGQDNAIARAIVNEGIKDARGGESGGLWRGGQLAHGRAFLSKAAGNPERKIRVNSCAK